MKEHELYSRMLSELSASEIAILKNVTPDNLKAEFHSCWHDDHQPCIGCKINGVPVAFWWLDVELAGAFHYTDSQLSRDAIITMLSTRLQDLEAGA